MGYVYADVKIGDPQRRTLRNLRMLVDTGSTYAAIPPALAQELGLQIERDWPVTVADGRQVTAGITLAFLEVDGRETLIKALVFDVSEPLLGAFTLGELGLAVDPASGTLKPSRSFIMRL